MIEEISKNFFRIDMALPLRELGSVNSYIIRGSEKNLIVDTGMRNDACMNAMQASLKELGINLKETEFFITHSHGDHFGLVTRLAHPDSTIHINKLEVGIIEKVRSGAILSDVRDFLQLSGFPEKDVGNVLPPDAGRPFRYEGSLPFLFVDDGNVLDVGDYHFRCIATPGHSRGHMSLYEPDRKMFVAGDHLLSDITPGIQGRLDNENPLKDYLSALERVHPLDVDLVLPGHRGLCRAADATER